MFTKVCIIITIYFICGAVLSLIINRRKSTEDRKKQWLKYLFYLLIVSAVVIIIRFTDYFEYFSALVLCLGFYELWRTGRVKRAHNRLLITTCLLIYAAISLLFFLFSASFPKNLLLFIYTLVFTFDGFSQLSGQLFGRHKLWASVSPNKTIEGFVGGALMTLITSFLLYPQVSQGFLQVTFITLLAIFSALCGDLLASAYKRVCKVKDYSQLIPGHGGILDRFDSFLSSGSACYLFSTFNPPILLW